jgi:NhaA family Na+:H+ antiporter
MGMNGGPPPKLTEPVSERDHTLGPRDASVTLVYYGDHQCPHCRFAFPIFEELGRQLEGRVRFVYRYFPLTTVHPQAELAAQAAEAAAEQGKFWEMNALLFERQDNLDFENLLTYAGELGLDLPRFENELKAEVHRDRVQQDFESGVRSGVNGTPTFFINGERYDGAWDLDSLLEAIEKPLGFRIRLVAQEFLSISASGGIVLMLATLIALVWANSSWLETYFHLWETSFSLRLGNALLSEHLLEWVNDGLMVIFFFVVGLEIKREVTAGELASPRLAALPIAAALGGMLVPALIYAALNLGGPGAHGWGIPMATDIAFTLGILTVLGRRVPLSLKVFFTAMAIADDLGAVLMIAIFYSKGIVWSNLLVGALILLLLFALNRARIYSPLPYAILGIGLWLAFLGSGVHPTIAGVLLALTIPTRAPASTKALLAQSVSLLEEFELPPEWSSPTNSRRQAAATSLETIIDRLQSPAQKLEHQLNPWSTFLILPIFALANAGVTFIGTGSPQNLFNPISLGIILGLVIGKPLGLTLFSWLAVRLDIARLPAGVNWAQFISATFLAGIGFTISLFIANAAFDDPALVASAKIAILLASILSALTGWVLLTLNSTPHDQSTRSELIQIE